MCRTPIQAYFLVSPEDSEEEGEAEERGDDSEQAQAPLLWQQITDTISRALVVAENIVMDALE